MLLALLPMFSIAQSPYADSPQAGKLDGGKMWTFDNPPLDYFRQTYNFNPDQNWFDKARLGALRFATYCSASFVSPNGLIMTNHHCARESVTKISNGGGLVDNGFVAKDLRDEVKVPDLFVEQLIEIRDVTGQVHAAGDADAQRTQMASQLEKDLTAAAGTGHRVQVIRMYSGAKYAAYTFKRYDDIRLVMAPELAIAYFGGDYDNFTYPRFNLDMAFFRAYGADGKPLNTTDMHFKFSNGNLKEGDAVYTLGNPGTTNRLQSVAILEYRRDVAQPANVEYLKKGLELLKTYWDPADEEKMSTYFSMSNSLKAQEGRLAGLQDPTLIARKRDAETQLVAAIQNDSALKDRYGKVFEDLMDIQRQKRELAPTIQAMAQLSGQPYESALIKRGLLASMYQTTQNEQQKNAALAMKNDKPELEKAALLLRLRWLADKLGADHELLKAAGFGDGKSVEQVADALLANSVLANDGGVETLMGSWASSDDVGVKFGRALAQTLLGLQGKIMPLNAKERELLGQVAQAKFAVYGTAIPPDATFSLRISDGVVKGYNYNGTYAPAFTTFYGLLDRYHSFNGKGDWKLPNRWVSLPADLNLGTPFNFVSTNDIIGGNSGSPLVNNNLEVVGLAFDSNVEGLPGEFIYVDTANRTVSVDARAMVESLDKVFDMDRIAQELRTGRVFDTEAAADATMRTTTPRNTRNTGTRNTRRRN